MCFKLLSMDRAYLDAATTPIFVVSTHPSVIAFSSDSPMYRTMDGAVNADNIKAFINEIRDNGIDDFVLY